MGHVGADLCTLAFVVSYIVAHVGKYLESRLHCTHWRFSGLRAFEELDKTFSHGPRSRILLGGWQVQFCLKAKIEMNKS